MALGTSDKEGGSGSQVARTFETVQLLREDVAAEEACLIDAAIVSSVTTIQSAGACPSNIEERFEGTRELQPSRCFTGFSPTVNQESRVLVKGKFCLGTLFVGGPPPL